MNEIRITLNGEELTLMPHFKAAMNLCRKHGGLLPMMDAINLGSLELATDVVFFALEKGDSERDQVREQVYSAGLSYLAPHLVRYIIALMYGGKVPSDTKSGDQLAAETRSSLADKFANA